jgi:UDP-N-acetylmuramoyl-tripeptide--D-alanyl-D-alanine ligase
MAEALPLWTADEIAAATGGVASGAFVAGGVSIDTRSLEAGDLFVALAGARDGHEFLAAARARGATGALVSRPVDAPHVLVGDVFAALEALGRAARKRPPQLACAAVTGSVGKTSVTQAIAAALHLAGHGHSSVKSYNNHIGVPLTLARMPRDTRRAVFEIGMNHADEITPLVGMVRPDVAVVTTVGPVHIENFPDGETGVARAKAEIFSGLKPGGRAVLNADNRWFGMLRDAAGDRAAEVVAVGSAPGCDARLLGLAADGNGQIVSAEIGGERLDFHIAQSGDHWGLNALMVLVTTDALGVPRATALQALADFGPLAGRGAERTVTLAGGTFTLVDESYNANPISMRAVITALGARPAAGRRILALTDMLELGEQGPALHAALADDISAARVDQVFCAGPLMHALWQALSPDIRGAWADDAGSLASELKGAVRPGDVVVVKGSNGSRASLIVEALAGLGSD